MRALPLIAASLIAVSACGQGEAEPVPVPAQVEPAAAAEPTPEPVVVPVSVDAACRYAARVQYGQADADVVYDAVTGTVSWPAPVDGGRLTFSCAVQGGQVALSREGQTQIITYPTPAAGPAEKETR
jgi:hypothetical protein